MGSNQMTDSNLISRQQDIAALVASLEAMMPDGDGYNDPYFDPVRHAIAALQAQPVQQDIVNALRNLMADIGGGKKFCNHDFSCRCAWENAITALKAAEQAQGMVAVGEPVWWMAADSEGVPHGNAHASKADAQAHAALINEHGLAGETFTAQCFIRVDKPCKAAQQARIQEGE